MLQVSPSEYQRFIYKCHTCMLGFKRRGMLVNHLNKRHPNIKPESVHELSLPILKQQRDYYCQHCDKVGSPSDGEREVGMDFFFVFSVGGGGYGGGV